MILSMKQTRRIVIGGLAIIFIRNVIKYGIAIMDLMKLIVHTCHRALHYFIRVFHLILSISLVYLSIKLVMALSIVWEDQMNHIYVDTKICTIQEIHFDVGTNHPV
jgi:hypothetical protein